MIDYSLNVTPIPQSEDKSVFKPSFTHLLVPDVHVMLDKTFVLLIGAN